MRAILWTLFLTLCSVYSYAQSTLNVKVVDAASGEKLQGASVGETQGVLLGNFLQQN
jgi:hypothetical protein